MAQPVKNILAVGLDDFQRRRLERIHSGEGCRFHALLPFDEVVHATSIRFDALLAQARRELDHFPGRVDAIIAHWAFPTSSLVPILCAERGLRSPSLRAALQCSHKYWSRLAQRDVVPRVTPQFCAFDPFDEPGLHDLEMEPPFWIKPIEGFASLLGFKIRSERDFDEALETLRREIGRVGTPFDQVLSRVELPEEMRAIGGTHCIAEEYLTGREFAHEGHVYQGSARIHGTLDMLRRNETFLGYERPSELPREVLDRAELASIELMTAIGFDDGVFNAEYFWNPEDDRLAIVEVNPRMSESHSYLWEKVDGCSSHEIAIDIALGRPPRTHPRAGRYAKAAKMFVRSFEPGVVSGVPGADEIARVRDEIPDADVQLEVEPGQDLRELVDQDAYSFILASVFIPADDHAQLLERYDRVCEMLSFSIEEAA